MSDRFISKNPFTQEVYAEFPETTPEELDTILQASHSDFLEHARLSYAERGAKLVRLAQALREHKEELALLMTHEMGKPLSQSTSEVLKCADCCEYYAEHAKRLLAPTEYQVDGASCYVRYEPLGPILSIMPFNFPLWMPIKTCVPLFMAGNTYVLKPPETTPRTALRLAELAEAAGLSFRVAFLSRHLIEQAIASDLIKGVTLTASVPAGRAVAACAGQHLKKCVLELSGSDPFIVLPDADIDNAAKTLVTTRLMGCGQVCISPKRIIVHENIYDEVVEKVLAQVRIVNVTDPASLDCVIGPMAREDLAEIAKKQVDESVALGAKLLHGGQLQGPCLLTPAVLTDVTEEMPVVRQEVFAPVFVFLKFRDEEEALRLANNSPFGLGAAIFTGDGARAERELVPRVDAGMVFVNDFVKSIVPVPFGGTKVSGLGRELGESGIKEFTNPKTVVIKS